LFTASAEMGAPAASGNHPSTAGTDVGFFTATTRLAARGCPCPAAGRWRWERPAAASDLLLRYW